MKARICHVVEAVACFLLSLVTSACYLDSDKNSVVRIGIFRRHFVLLLKNSVTQSSSPHLEVRSKYL